MLATEAVVASDWCSDLLGVLRFTVFARWHVACPLRWVVVVRHREGTRSVGRSLPLDLVTQYERVGVFLRFYTRGLTRTR